MREGNSVQILPFIVQTGDVYSVWGRAIVYKYYPLSCRQVMYTLYEGGQQCTNITLYRADRWCILCIREGNNVKMLPFIVQTDDVYSVWGRATVYKYYPLSCRQVMYTLHQRGQQNENVTFYRTDRWWEGNSVQIWPFIVQTGDVYSVWGRATV